MPREICKHTHFFTLHLVVTKKTVGDGEKLLTYLNSALKALLGFDIFPRGPKQKVKFCCLVKYVKIHIFSHFTWLSQKKTLVMEKNYLHI